MTTMERIMRPLLKPVLWMVGRLNPRMHVLPEQYIPLSVLQKLESGVFQTPNGPLVIDLGGGGEGIIGQFLGNRVTAIDIREDELKDAPDGPIKVVADARALPFEDQVFDSATAFYFLMYLKTGDLSQVLSEAYRVLKPGGQLYIWDACIPMYTQRKDKLIIAPVKVQLPSGTVSTAYGTPWFEKVLNAQQITTLASSIGFTVVEETTQRQAFSLTLQKTS